MGRLGLLDGFEGGARGGGEGAVGGKGRLLKTLRSIGETGGVLSRGKAPGGGSSGSRSCGGCEW